MLDGLFLPRILIVKWVKQLKHKLKHLNNIFLVLKLMSHLKCVEVKSATQNELFWQRVI